MKQENKNLDNVIEHILEMQEQNQPITVTVSVNNSIQENSRHKAMTAAYEIATTLTHQNLPYIQVRDWSAPLRYVLQAAGINAHSYIVTKDKLSLTQPKEKVAQNILSPNFWKEAGLFTAAGQKDLSDKILNIEKLQPQDIVFNLYDDLWGGVVEDINEYWQQRVREIIHNSNSVLIIYGCLKTMKQPNSLTTHILNVEVR